MRLIIIPKFSILIKNYVRTLRDNCEEKVEDYGLYAFSYDSGYLE